MGREGSGSGSIPLTSGSGSESGRPKNMLIRIPNTDSRTVLFDLLLCRNVHFPYLICSPCMLTPTLPFRRGRGNVLCGGLMVLISWADHSKAILITVQRALYQSLSSLHRLPISVLSVLYFNLHLCVLLGLINYLCNGAINVAWCCGVKVKILCKGPFWILELDPFSDFAG